MPRAPGDRSAFLQDVTYADGSPVEAGSRLEKIWAIQNTGDVTWEDRWLTCQDEDLEIRSGDGTPLTVGQNLVPENRSVPLPRTLPGESAEISVVFTAPTTPCTVISYWKMTYADGRLCFPEGHGLWAKVRVVAATMEAESRLDDETPPTAPRRRAGR